MRAILLALLLVACRERDPLPGMLGGRCYDDGTCKGQLVCRDHWDSFWGHTYFRCEPPEETKTP